jgi:hypothetical protein
LFTTTFKTVFEEALTEFMKLVRFIFFTKAFKQDLKMSENKAWPQINVAQWRQKLNQAGNDNARGGVKFEGFHHLMTEYLENFQARSSEIRDGVEWLKKNNKPAVPADVANDPADAQPNADADILEKDGAGDLKNEEPHLSDGTHDDEADAAEIDISPGF